MVTARPSGDSIARDFLSGAFWKIPGVGPHSAVWRAVALGMDDFGGVGGKRNSLFGVFVREHLEDVREFRQRRFKIRAGKIEDEDGLEESSLAYQRLMHEIYASQRSELVRLRNNREISSEVMRRVERELDLEESRLEV